MIEAKVVQEVFERFSEIVHLHVANQTIRTTPKHPFYVYDRGWTPVNEINAGEWILTETGDWQAVQEIYATGEWETVYNLRVEDHHTYFVGDDDWGWSAWAHNACKDVYIAKDDTNPGNYTAYDKNNGIKIKVTADGKTLAKGTAVSKPNFADAKKFLLDNQESFGIRPSKIDTYDPSDNSDESDIKWRDKVGKPDARSVEKKPDAVAEFEAFQTTNPNFFTDLHPDPADPTNVSARKTGQQLTGDSSYPADMNAFIHAHHIVVRNGGDSVRQSHQLLRTVGIDPYYGKANLAWAPNWTNHRQGTKYRDAVWDKLYALGIQINNDPDAAYVDSMKTNQARVIDTLKSIADAFFRARISM